MRQSPIRLSLHELEKRDQPNATAVLSGTVLEIDADAMGGRLDVFQAGDQIVVRSRGAIVGSVPAAGVTAIEINNNGGGAGSDIVRVDNALRQLATINGVASIDKISGGGGTTTLNGGASEDVVVGGNFDNTFITPDGDLILKALQGDAGVPVGPRALPEVEIPPPNTAIGLPQETMTQDEVATILRRAAAASSTNDAIIVIVDRNGRILGVRVEGQVDADIRTNTNALIFAIDGAVAKARTGAFFGNNEAPLTSRTIQTISQSTITEREVNSNPNITNGESTVRGPGFVAPVGIKAHFPPGVPFTPQVDLFAIEHTNRDGRYAPGADHIIGTADDLLLSGRFNTGLETLNRLFAPESYGVESGLSPTIVRPDGTIVPVAQSRGIATLPGGIPLMKKGQIVGGIGVFFPGKTGYATEENSVLSSTFDPTKQDRSLEAEYIAFAAAGGAKGTLGENTADYRIGTINGVPLPAGYGLAFARIDLVGIQLDLFGPGGAADGPRALLRLGQALGVGHPESGGNQVVDFDAFGDNRIVRDGVAAADGWIVAPRNGNGVSAADVTRIVEQGITQANETRAAIRAPFGTRAKFVFAVSDVDGNIVGLYRMADATIFSIDVAVAKARNVNYYASDKLQPEDQLTGVDVGTAFSNRTFRYLANPRFPTGIDGAPFGQFSQLNDLGVDPLTGRTVGAPLPASAYRSVLGFDAFNPGTNFREQTNRRNHNGIVFFPGSAPIYRGNLLIGGFGVSGDGVDQDDVTTDGGQVGFGVPVIYKRADQIVYQGVRLPYQKFNRNPEG